MKGIVKPYAIPILMFGIFEMIAIVLWQTKGNLFYLFNFSYIGLAISIGVYLFICNYKHARRFVQLFVGLYMLIYLGLICNENMQIEGFWYYLFTGVFESAIMRLPKLLDRLCLGGDGVVMPVGLQWYWIFCRIKCQNSREKR